MRNSGEGSCFYPDYGVNATDYSYTLAEVFFNICGLVEAEDIYLPGVSLVFLRLFILKLIAQTCVQIGICLVAGWYTPWIDSHQTEVDNVKEEWGDNKPCSIGV